MNIGWNFERINDQVFDFGRIFIQVFDRFAVCVQIKSMENEMPFSSWHNNERCFDINRDLRRLTVVNVWAFFSALWILMLKFQLAFCNLQYNKLMVLIPIWMNHEYSKVNPQYLHWFPPLLEQSSEVKEHGTSTWMKYIYESNGFPQFYSFAFDSHTYNYKHFSWQFLSAMY